MRKKAKKRIFTAWLLLATLLPFFAVKGFHYHEEEESVACHSQDGDSHPSSHQCPVCSFTLSPFTQAETFQLEIMLPVFDYKPEIITDEICRVQFYPYHLRAPPLG